MRGGARRLATRALDEMAIAVGRETDFRALAREILWYLRAERSQREFARLIGYRSNAASAWETSRTFPSAERLLSICDRLGIDVLWVLNDFAPECACTLEGMPASALSLGAWLNALRGEAPLNALAKATGFSRHQLGAGFVGRPVRGYPSSCCWFRCARVGSTSCSVASCHRPRDRGSTS
jgi:transcriptional regulator with XRE-family HTH domain